jgi:hypothetical protein
MERMIKNPEGLIEMIAKFLAVGSAICIYNKN